jgi:hypothetical protein
MSQACYSVNKDEKGQPISVIQTTGCATPGNNTNTNDNVKANVNVKQNIEQLFQDKGIMSALLEKFPQYQSSTPQQLSTQFASDPESLKKLFQNSPELQAAAHKIADSGLGKFAARLFGLKPENVKGVINEFAGKDKKKTNATPSKSVEENSESQPNVTSQKAKNTKTTNPQEVSETGAPNVTSQKAEKNSNTKNPQGSEIGTPNVTSQKAEKNSNTKNPQGVSVQTISDNTSQNKEKSGNKTLFGEWPKGKPGDKTLFGVLKDKAAEKISTWKTNRDIDKAQQAFQNFAKETKSEVGKMATVLQKPFTQVTPVQDEPSKGFLSKIKNTFSRKKAVAQVQAEPKKGGKLIKLVPTQERIIYNGLKKVVYLNKRTKCIKHYGKIIKVNNL